MVEDEEPKYLFYRHHRTSEERDSEGGKKIFRGYSIRIGSGQEYDDETPEGLGKFVGQEIRDISESTLGTIYTDMISRENSFADRMEIISPASQEEIDAFLVAVKEAGEDSTQEQ